MICDAFFCLLNIFRAILSCLPLIYRECRGTAIALIQTPPLIGEPRKKDTGGAGRGQGAEIGDDGQDPRSGDTKLETEPGGGRDLETEGPGPDLCLPPDLEMNGPEIIVRWQLWRKDSQVIEETKYIGFIIITFLSFSVGQHNHFHL